MHTQANASPSLRYQVPPARSPRSVTTRHGLRGRGDGLGDHAAVAIAGRQSTRSRRARDRKAIFDAAYHRHARVQTPVPHEVPRRHQQQVDSPFTVSTDHAGKVHVLADGDAMRVHHQGTRAARIAEFQAGNQAPLHISLQRFARREDLRAVDSRGIREHLVESRHQRHGMAGHRLGQQCTRSLGLPRATKLLFRSDDVSRLFEHELAHLAANARAVSRASFSLR